MLRLLHTEATRLSEDEPIDSTGLPKESMTSADSLIRIYWVPWKTLHFYFVFKFEGKSTKVEIGGGGR